MNALGFHPQTGEFLPMEATHVCSEMFQIFLDQAATSIVPIKERNILFLDNLSWHKNKFLKWHGLEPLCLPPCSPDLNPVERLWLVLKDRWVNNHICRNSDELIERLDRVLLDLIGRPEDLKITTSFGELL